MPPATPPAAMSAPTSGSTFATRPPTFGRGTPAALMTPGMPVAASEACSSLPPALFATLAMSRMTLAPLAVWANLARLAYFPAMPAPFRASPAPPSTREGSVSSSTISAPVALPSYLVPLSRSAPVTPFARAPASPGSRSARPKVRWLTAAAMPELPPAWVLLNVPLLMSDFTSLATPLMMSEGASSGCRAAPITLMVCWSDLTRATAAASSALSSPPVFSFCWADW